MEKHHYLQIGIVCIRKKNYKVRPLLAYRNLAVAAKIQPGKRKKQYLLIVTD